MDWRRDKGLDKGGNTAGERTEGGGFQLTDLLPAQDAELLK